MLVSGDVTSGQAGRLPAPSDYAVALRNPSSAFSRADLQRAVFKRGPLGIVVQTGENAVVARAVIDGREVAVRCHVNDDPSRESRFRIIDEHLKSLGAKVPAAICRAEYIDGGIIVRGASRPVSLMPWVAGENLHQYVKNGVEQPEQLRRLAEQWLDLSKELRDAEYVHGDPSHRNIVITESGIRLIDPDVAWVPALGRTTPSEAGHPAFQHPGRARAKTSLELDNFPNLVVYLSLRALASDPSLWRFSGSERLILDGRDFAQPHTSEAFTAMLSSPDPEVRSWTAKLMQLCLGSIDDVPSLEDFVRPAVREDAYERSSTAPGAFTLPPNSRRASWLAAHLASSNGRPA
jgi:hypothetical protein